MTMSAMDSDLKVVRFAVDTRPVCLWLLNPIERNLEFLQCVDPRYFEFVARGHAEQLEGESKQAAALSLRAAHSHALEAFFAFLTATVQAPECISWCDGRQVRLLSAASLHRSEPHERTSARGSAG